MTYWIALRLMLLIQLIIMLPALSTHALANPGSVTIEAILGDKLVVVQGQDGKHRTVGRGAQVHPGETIKTGARASAKILYPDGSKIFVGRSSQLEISLPKNGAQTANLKQGEIRSLIKKTSTTSQPKFVIRSKTAVLGVRGTDFVTEIPEALPGASQTAATELHTIEGTVDIAPSEDALFQGKGVTVEGGQTVQASTQGISKISQFDSFQYMQKLSTAQPEFVELIRTDEDFSPKNWRLQENQTEGSIEEKPEPLPWNFRKNWSSWSLSFERLANRYRVTTYYNNQSYSSYDRDQNAEGGHLAWTPFHPWSGSLGLQMQAGVSLLKFRGKGLLLTNACAGPSLTALSPFIATLCVGIETVWRDLSKRDTGLEAQLLLAYEFKKPAAGFKKIFAALSTSYYAEKWDIEHIEGFKLGVEYQF